MVKILIDTDNKLPNDTTLKSFVILITWIIKSDDKFYTQILHKKDTVA